MKISQREARRLKKRVVELEQLERNRRSLWPREYPGGANISTVIDIPTTVVTAIRTAALLGHYVIAISVGTSEVRFYAVRHDA